MNCSLLIRFFCAAYVRTVWTHEQETSQSGKKTRPSFCFPFEELWAETMLRGERYSIPFHNMPGSSLLVYRSLLVHSSLLLKGWRHQKGSVSVR